MRDVRLLVDPPAAGAWNMAVDETLLETASSTGTATLRFYGWDQPTLSLGYFQAVSERQQHAASLDCHLVRRSSGGGAILHDRELTYSIAIAQRHPRSDDARGLYDALHQTLIETFAALGIAAELYRSTMSNCRSGPESTANSTPFLCFQRRTCTDIVYNGEKIVGSAQRRSRGAVLQHGSILLARSPFAPELPGLAELGGARVEPAELASRWLARLAGRLGFSYSAGELSPDEKIRAQSVVQAKFGAGEYLQRRR